MIETQLNNYSWSCGYVMQLYTSNGISKVGKRSAVPWSAFLSLETGHIQTSVHWVVVVRITWSTNGANNICLDNPDPKTPEVAQVVWWFKVDTTFFIKFSGLLTINNYWFCFCCLVKDTDYTCSSTCIRWIMLSNVWRFHIGDHRLLLMYFYYSTIEYITV